MLSILGRKNVGLGARSAPNPTLQLGSEIRLLPKQGTIRSLYHFDDKRSVENDKTLTPCL